VLVPSSRTSRRLPSRPRTTGRAGAGPMLRGHAGQISHGGGQGAAQFPVQILAAQGHRGLGAQEPVGLVFSLNDDFLDLAQLDFELSVRSDDRFLPGLVARMDDLQAHRLSGRNAREE
jgi:hypothetical protein